MKVLEEKSYKCIKGFTKFYETNCVYDIAFQGELFYSLNEYEQIVVFDKKFMEEHFEEL